MGNGRRPLGGLHFWLAHCIFIENASVEESLPWLKGGALLCLVEPARYIRTNLPIIHPIDAFSFHINGRAFHR